MGPDRQRDRLTRHGQRLDRIATYGLPEPRRSEELIDRAATFDQLAELIPARQLRRWKLRSTIAELVRRVGVECRDDPSTLPAAFRLLLVSVSTAVMSTLSFNPSAVLLDRRDPSMVAVFTWAQLCSGVMVLWIVAVLLRHPDHLPLRQLALPHLAIAAAMAVQAVTNSPLIVSDHLYTAAATLTVIALGLTAAAGFGLVPQHWARVGFRVNALAAGLTGLNVFDWVRRTYGAISVAGGSRWR